VDPVLRRGWLLVAALALVESALAWVEGWALPLALTQVSPLALTQVSPLALALAESALAVLLFG
tara:strand:- start:122 stop:313 length:192 start_codon:yes stop_codon:yes gene_type:complete